ncbi:MAG: c-type cytochrome, partial [Terriglobales bacterium]
MLRQGVAGAFMVLALLGAAWAQAEDTPASSATAAAPAAGGGGGGDVSKTPPEVVGAAAKGTLKDPYKDDNADIDAQGHKLFLQYSCNGCHGGTGGGGICPHIINDVWVYDGDDDTLFRLVTLGSVGLQAAGYMRKGHENVVAPMPPFGQLIPTADDLWKIITFVRSAYKGSPSRKFGN